MLPTVLDHWHSNGVRVGRPRVMGEFELGMFGHPSGIRGGIVLRAGEPLLAGEERKKHA